MEWEGVRHPFYPNRVWFSRLMTNVPLYAWYEWYVAYVKHLTKLSHINLFMNAYFSLLKKKNSRTIFVNKKIGFWFVCKKIRSFFKQSKIKNKKIGFWFVCKKNQIYFVNEKI